MRLVVDANILVGEATRERRGRLLLAHVELELFATERVWDETRHEIVKRYRAMRDGTVLRHTEQSAAELAERSLAFLVSLVQPIGLNAPLPFPEVLRGNAVRSADFEPEARRRGIPDPDDIPTAALALALDVAIWSEDKHFYGCGIAVWTTERLRSYLGV